MFDISWSELLILGVVTLVFVGPKELPVLMRTLGRYAGVIRRHANEFKSQFAAAMREAELDSMRAEVDKMQASINSDVMRAHPKNDDVDRTSVATDVGGPSLSVNEASSMPERELPMPPMPAPPRAES